MSPFVGKRGRGLTREECFDIFANMETTQAVTALGALAQGSRLAAFRLLVGEGPDGLPAGAIAERLQIPPATLSFHMAQLAHAGLVRARREGRSVIYSVDFENMRALLGFLAEHCCGGDPEACGLEGGTPELAAPDPAARGSD